MTENEKSYRDRLTILDEKGHRVWVYSKKPKGKFYTYRSIIGYFLTLLFFIFPFVKMNNEPFILINVLERKFIFFGAIFWPQDSYIFFLAFISMFVFIILFTVVYGRAWCGWACPQTVFTELIYRRIEYLIEGNYSKQKRLNQSKWNFEKISKKFIKHLIFYIISFLITNTLFSYFTGIDNIVSAYSAKGNNGLLTAIFVFSLFLHLLYGKIRELACTIICPYGRLQSVLLDENSIVVAYDYNRGEPRFHYNPLENRKEAGKGDCIDCKNCMLVCPTNIDIRNGTQLECTNCTACIDACNQIMKNTGKPKGLIRFASSKQIATGVKFKITGGIIFYTGILAALLLFLSYLLISRTAVETTIMRTPGLLFQEQPENKISNLYNIKIVNKTHKELPVQLKVIDQKAEIQIAGNSLTVNKEQVAEGVFFVMIEKQNIKSEKTTLKIGIYSGDLLLEEIQVMFVAPIK